MNLQLRHRLKSLVPAPLRDDIINLIFSTRAMFFKGNKVYCPCCDSSFSGFYSSGTIGSCPKCGSGARHRSVMLFLKNNTDFFKSRLKVLHFAPEFCFNERFKKSSNLEYVSADLDSARAAERIDMTDINYADNTFDVILSIHVLEHIVEDQKAMKELYRIMKPGGWAVLQVPMDLKRDKTFEDPAINTNAEREKIYGHFDHKRIYGRDYKARLENAGFKVSNENYIANFDAYDIKKYGLKDYEEIYLCRK